MWEKKIWDHEKSFNKANPLLILNASGDNKIDFVVAELSVGSTKIKFAIPSFLAISSTHT